METTKIIAELLNITDFIIIKSVYQGWEIWFDFRNEKYNRKITVCYDFCYTKNIDNLPGEWENQLGEYVLYF